MSFHAMKGCCTHYEVETVLHGSTVLWQGLPVLDANEIHKPGPLAKAAAGLGFVILLVHTSHQLTSSGACSDNIRRHAH